MAMFESGTRVKRGYYFGAKSWTLHGVATDGEVLPGARGEKHLKVPLLAAIALAPLMGAAFLMFLPVIGFFLVGRALLRPVTRLFTKPAEGLAATMAPGWVPGEAHLTGDAAEKKEGAPAAHPEAEALAKEIEAKRAPKA